MKKPTNLRTMVITTASGTDVKDTTQLKGEAHESAGMRAKNVLEQYTVGGPPKDNLGGKPGYK